MSNTLRLEDDAIERCVGICNAMVSQVDQAIKNADQLRFVSGFGGFDSAQQLQARYDEKFNGGDGSGSVRERLREFRDVILTMRDTFTAGVKRSPTRIARSVSRSQAFELEPTNDTQGTLRSRGPHCPAGRMWHRIRERRFRSGRYAHFNDAGTPACGSVRQASGRL